MARKQIVTLIDDISGDEAAESLTFGLDGITYEIDLTTEHAAELRQSLARWVNAGRRSAGSNNRTRVERRSTTSRNDLELVRAWARENGHNVSSRGRVAATILKAYDAAHA